MYHFSDQQTADFLKKSKKNITTKIIFSELRRTSLAYFLYKIGSIFLPFSKIVKQDGLTAIARAFKKKELIHIFEIAGFKEYTIKYKWAFRFLILIDTKN